MSSEVPSVDSGTKDAPDEPAKSPSRKKVKKPGILAIKAIQIFKTPKEIKNDIEKHDVSIKIDEIEAKLTGNIIIYPQTNEDYEKILKNSAILNGIKKIDLRTVIKHNIVIKSMSMDIAREYITELQNLGVTSTEAIGKSGKNKIIKAHVEDKDTRALLIKDGIRIDYFIYKVEEYKKPIHVLQCYHCQGFNHTFEKCPKKEEKPICMKCSDKHKTKD